jgi:hypothetical protein
MDDAQLPIIERTYDHHCQSLCLVYAVSSAPAGYHGL